MENSGATNQPDSDQRPSNVYIGNINIKATEEDLKTFLEENGVNVGELRSLSFRKGFAFLGCPTKLSAEEIINILNGKEFQEKTLVVEFSLTSSISRSYDSPLKILVASDYVGAIIGRGGITIKDLTRSTGARINVLKNQSPVATAEKIISISANPESTISAARKILEICIKEAQVLRPGKEIGLKILALNTLVGRVIGKEGKNIKKLIEDTQTKIYVSSQAPKDTQINYQTTTSNAATTAQYAPVPQPQQYWDPVTLNEERVITIYGSVDGIVKAAEHIYSKLRIGNSLNFANRVVYIPSTNFSYII